MATSNDGHFETRGPVVLAVTTAMLVCSTVFVALRLGSRIGIVKKIQWDDYFMILAWFISFGLSYSIVYGTSVGLGRHERDVPDGWNPKLKRSEYVFSVLYNPALMATKTSILIFYLTLSKSQKVFRWCTIATLAAVNLAGMALTILNIVQCRPVDAAFETPIPESAHCTDIVTIYLSSAPVNIITDLAILFLPMPILTGMNLPKKQKTILVITFGFGIFVAVVDVVRIAYLQQAATTRLRDIQTNFDASSSQSRNSEVGDFSWYASLSFMWSAIEVHVGIMCACVPALKPLVSRFLPHLLRDASEIERSRLARRGSGMRALESSSPLRVPSNGEPSTPHPTSPPPVLDPNDPMSQIDVLEFLTTPDMQYPGPTDLSAQMDTVTNTATTNVSRHTRTLTPTFFDFVKVRRKKNMLEMTVKESYFPIAMVTVLFLVWGVAYGLLDVLNSQFQSAAHMTSGQGVGIHSAYFGGYLVGPLTFGRIVLKRWGFKACYIVGLIIYACGTLIFWPSAVLTSFPAFLVSNFIVGMGLSTLEIAANPFIALCGPPEHGEARLNLSQGIQAIGSVVSPLLAKRVLFRVKAEALIDVQWAYLGIALFTVLLAVGYYYVPLPEATEEQLEAAANDRGDAINLATVGSSNVKVIYVTLVLGVISQFCYVGGQEAVSTTFGPYITRAMPSLDITNHQAIAHTAFAVARFVAALGGLIFKPRYLLLFFYIGVIVFSILAMNFDGSTPAALIVMVFFFEGPIFSLIFAQCLHGLGRRTKDASALITAAISSGAVFPPISYGVTKARGPQYAMCVAVAAYAVGAMLPLYTTLFPIARRQVDPVETPEEKHVGPLRRASRVFTGRSPLTRREVAREMSLPVVEPRGIGIGVGKEGEVSSEMSPPRTERKESSAGESTA